MTDTIRLRDLQAVTDTIRTPFAQTKTRTHGDARVQDRDAPEKWYRGNALGFGPRARDAAQPASRQKQIAASIKIYGGCGEYYTIASKKAGREVIRGLTALSGVLRADIMIKK